MHYRELQTALCEVYLVNLNFEQRSANQWSTATWNFDKICGRFWTL